jgi:hypothetical protein
MTINAGIPEAFMGNFIGFWITSLPGITLSISTNAALSAALVVFTWQVLSLYTHPLCLLAQEGVPEPIQN